MRAELRSMLDAARVLTPTTTDRATLFLADRAAGLAGVLRTIRDSRVTLADWSRWHARERSLVLVARDYVLLRDLTLGDRLALTEEGEAFLAALAAIAAPAARSAEVA